MQSSAGDPESGADSGFARRERRTPPVPESPRFPLAVWTEPVRPRLARTIIVSVTIGILAFVVLGVVLSLLYIGGPRLILPAIVAAIVPLVAVTIAIAWVDRWEPEPFPLLVMCLLWGAGVAVVLTLLFDAGLSQSGYVPTSALVPSLIQAPIVEEFVKGLGLLLVFLLGRRFVDGPLDGLVYGAVIASGFAFTENVFYFVDALSQSPELFGATFTLRAVLAPFAHVMFTAVLGLAWGASIRSRPIQAAVLLVLGYAGAVALHALWNTGIWAIADAEGYVLYLMLIQLPLFAFAVWVIVALRREEVRVTRLRLSEYQAAGWFTRGEVRMLSSWNGRRQAGAWAKSLPGNKRAAMNQFTSAAIRLAFTRQRIVTDARAAAPDVESDLEAGLLRDLVSARQVLLGP